MRTPLALTAFTALVLAAPAAAAQEPGALPRDLAERITEVLNDPATERHEGGATVEAGRTVAGDVAVLDGDLALAGRVRGDVVVVNGDLALADSAEVTGDVIVVGGDIGHLGEARVDGEIVVYADPVTHCRRGGRLHLEDACGWLARAPRRDDDAAEREPGPAGGPAAAPDDETRRQSSGAEFLFSAGRSYNRVEGLPVRFGAAVETAGRNPLRVQARAIFRTEDGPRLGPEQWGYDLRAEQYLGGHRALRIGARAYSAVEPIENWHLTDLENSLSTLLLHRDHRDHFAREGWSAYAVVTPPRSPVTLTGGVLRERHRSVAPGNPWTLLDNDAPWRPQPLVAEGPVRALFGVGVVDTRNEEWDPSSGWYVRAEIEHTLASDLTRPPFVAGSDESAVQFPSNRFGEYTRALLDLRRYNRISPSTRLNLRIAGGGSMSVFPLPPQRQHTLGGAGTMPAHRLFALDCGARHLAGRRGTGAEAAGYFFSGYGCDRFVLFQAEYRGDISLPLGTGRAAWRENGLEEEEEKENGWRGYSLLDAGLGWVLFADVGAGWTSLDDYHDEDTAMDVGAGILLGGVGFYFATPVRDVYNRGGPSFIIRLAPRF